MPALLTCESVRGLVCVGWCRGQCADGGVSVWVSSWGSLGVSACASAWMVVPGLVLGQNVG